MTTWANERCQSRGPGGEACALPAGHAGDHAAAAPPIQSSSGWPPPTVVPNQADKNASGIRLLITPLTVIAAGAAFGLLIGPMVLWLAIAAVIGVAYVLFASRR